MTPIQTLRAVLREEADDLRDYPREETHYQDGKLFALMSTIEKIDDIENGKHLEHEDQGNPREYLLYRGQGAFRVRTDQSEDHKLTLLVGELVVILYPGKKTVLVDIKSFPLVGPCDEILHARAYARYDPAEAGVLEHR